VFDVTVTSLIKQPIRKPIKGAAESPDPDAGREIGSGLGGEVRATVGRASVRSGAG
jgi:hypothetical protein